MDGPSWVQARFLLKPDWPAKLPLGVAHFAFLAAAELLLATYCLCDWVIPGGNTLSIEQEITPDHSETYIEHDRVL